MKQLVEAAINGAQAIGQLFEQPDDDWEPVLLTRHHGGKINAMPVGSFFANDQSKEAFSEYVLPAAVTKFGVTELVLVTSAWMLRLEGDETLEDAPRPRDSKDRIEVLIVSHVDADGITIYEAAIGRDPRGTAPPTLSEFEPLGGEEGNGISESSLLYPAYKAIQQAELS